MIQWFLLHFTISNPPNICFISHTIRIDSFFLFLKNNIAKSANRTVCNKSAIISSYDVSPNLYIANQKPNLIILLNPMNIKYFPS